MDFLSTYILNYLNITTASLDGQTSLNKLNTLKHGNNAEMNWQARKYLSKSLNTFLASEFHIQLDSSVIKTITLESLKNVSEGY